MGQKYYKTIKNAEGPGPSDYKVNIVAQLKNNPRVMIPSAPKSI
jgi:hypothetical protein